MLTVAPLALFLGLLIDRLLGDPDWLWRRIGHPVVWFGALIALFDRLWNDAAKSDSFRRFAGVVAIILLTAAAALAGWVLQTLFARLGLAGQLLQAGVIAVFLAQRSLSDHVTAVVNGLENSLEAGRAAVAMIVGRDPEQLDRPAICRAAIESLAENTSDGLVAPFLFTLAFGLPGLLAYKMVNTADSMIGHMNSRYRAFGMGAARLDDLLNWPAARLTALLFALLAPGRSAFKTAMRDAPQHRSPNAGWPEAAMAAALGLALGGPRRYGEVVVDAPMINAGGRREADIADIGAGLALYERLCNALLLFAALLVFV